MMEQRFRGLCVGGPHDGKTADHTGPHHRAAVFKRRPLPMSSSPDDITRTIDIEYVDYSFERLRCHDTGETLGIWRPEHQSMSETLKMLITGYHPAVSTD